MPRVVVTGMGVVTPVGQTLDAFFGALVEARSGISCVAPTVHPGNSSSSASSKASGTASGTASGGSSFAAGQVDFSTSSHWPPHQAAQFDRATQFALVAAAQAIADASLTLSEDESMRAGVYWGTGLGGASSIEESYRQLYAGHGRVRPTAVILGMNNAAAGQISIAHQLRGPVLNVSTACSSSAASVGEGFRAIKAGYADVIVAGGSEALVTWGNLRAWDAMRALAQADPIDVSRSCKPFSLDRSGIVLGEGAAALVLESADRAHRRGARIYAEIVGYGNAADAVGISAPAAGGQRRAMCAALTDARMVPADVGYLNAHGTATTIGDAVETEAIKQVFGTHAAALPVSSTKALHGHLMGATGAVELLAAILAMNRGVIPPTAHLDHPDPVCDLDYVPNEARRVALDAVMSNSFGFGGMNAVLLAKRFTTRTAD